MNKVIISEHITEEEIEHMRPGTLLEITDGASKGEIVIKTDGCNYPLVNLSDGYLYSHTKIGGLKFRVINSTQIIIR